MRRASNEAATLQVADDIVPIAEFKAHVSRVIRTLPARRRPVVITQNGRPAAVVLSPAEFDRLARRGRFLDRVDEGLADLDAGRVIGDAELGDLLDARYGAVPKVTRRRR